MRFINDILINFVSVDSALDVMIALFEKLEESDQMFTPEKQAHLVCRPSNYKEMISYLENNYVLAKLDDSGNIIEVYQFNGDRLL